MRKSPNVVTVGDTYSTDRFVGGPRRVTAVTPGGVVVTDKYGLDVEISYEQAGRLCDGR